MSQKILFVILLLSAPALACTGCLVSQVQFSSGLSVVGGLLLLGRRRQLQGWRSFCFPLGAFVIGTVCGVASNLVFHFHYMLAPFITVGATLISVGILGQGCPSLNKVANDPGFSPEGNP